MFGEKSKVTQRDVFGRQVVEALAQRRQAQQRNDIEAVKQILPEFTVRDRLGEIPVRRGDHADIGAARFRFTDALVLPFLQQSQ